jgi:hypothetical protein
MAYAATVKEISKCKTVEEINKVDKETENLHDAMGSYNRCMLMLNAWSLEDFIEDWTAYEWVMARNIVDKR